MTRLVSVNSKKSLSDRCFSCHVGLSKLICRNLIIFSLHDSLHMFYLSMFLSSFRYNKRWKTTEITNLCITIITLFIEYTERKTFEFSRKNDWFKYFSYTKKNFLRANFNSAQENFSFQTEKKNFFGAKKIFWARKTFLHEEIFYSSKKILICIMQNISWNKKSHFSVYLNMSSNYFLEWSKTIWYRKYTEKKV